MTSSRQFGSKKAAVGNTYSIFTPTGIVTRLSDTVDSTVFAIDKQSASSRSILTSTFYSLVLGIPLKMCRFVLTQMETLLGVKHRPIVSVQRRSLKTRRSSSGRKSTSDKMNDECCDHETSLNGENQSNNLTFFISKVYVVRYTSRTFYRSHLTPGL